MGTIIVPIRLEQLNADDIDVEKHRGRNVALALQLDVMLVTLDKKLLKAFPNRTAALQRASSQ